MKHIGMHFERTKREPLEKRLAGAWKEIAPRLLGYLLSEDNLNEDLYSQRDALVAATVIQWLGSPVGQGFLAEVPGGNQCRRTARPSVNAV